MADDSLKRLAALDRPIRVGFYLVSGFPLLTFSAALDPLRQANRLSKRKIFEWALISADGEPVSASSGITLPIDCAAMTAPRYDIVIVCAGIDYADSYASSILAWLRKLNREGCVLGALSTGVFLLAKAGLLEGRRCSVHWEALPSFRSEFPKSFVSDDIFAIDGRFLTSSGGTVTLDMMLYIVTVTHGYELASLISDQFNHPKIRRQDDAQRMLPEARFGITNAKLSFVIRRMEASLDQPVGIADLADSINLSPRQLERLFISDLGKTPQKFYIELRMTRARDLLLQSNLSIAEVAGICGYASSSHFGRFYRKQFNESPVQTRRLDQIGLSGLIQPGAHGRSPNSDEAIQ